MMGKSMRGIFLKIILIATLVACVGSLAACNNKNEDKEEKPWWLDVRNCEFKIEDSRSVEKSITYNLDDGDGNIYINYIYDKNETKEYIPTIRIFHNGIEQTFYTKVCKRESYNSFMQDYFQTVILNETGKYRVNLCFFQNKDEADKIGGENIGGLTLYITIK